MEAQVPNPVSETSTAEDLESKKQQASVSSDVLSSSQNKSEAGDHNRSEGKTAEEVVSLIFESTSEAIKAVVGEESTSKRSSLPLSATESGKDEKMTSSDSPAQCTRTSEKDDGSNQQGKKTVSCTIGSLSSEKLAEKKEQNPASTDCKLSSTNANGDNDMKLSKINVKEWGSLASIGSSQTSMSADEDYVSINEVAETSTFRTLSKSTPDIKYGDTHTYGERGGDYEDSRKLESGEFNEEEQKRANLYASFSNVAGVSGDSQWSVVSSDYQSVGIEKRPRVITRENSNEPVECLGPEKCHWWIIVVSALCIVIGYVIYYLANHGMVPEYLGIIGTSIVAVSFVVFSTSCIYISYLLSFPHLPLFPNFDLLGEVDTVTSMQRFGNPKTYDNTESLDIVKRICGSEMQLEKSSSMELRGRLTDYREYPRATQNNTIDLDEAMKNAMEMEVINTEKMIEKQSHDKQDIDQVSESWASFETITSEPTIWSSIPSICTSEPTTWNPGPTTWSSIPSICTSVELTSESINWKSIPNILTSAERTSEESKDNESQASETKPPSTSAELTSERSKDNESQAPQTKPPKPKEK